MDTTQTHGDYAAAVRAVVDAAPAMTAETVAHIGAIMRTPLSLPVDADAARVESAVSG